MKYDLIYLVDDFDMVNLLHCIQFRKLGVEEKVKVFTNPEEALKELLNDSGEDARILILLDINMPEMSGFGFLDHMVGGPFSRNIDVIIVTSSVSDSDREMAYRYTHVKDFVTKPLKLEKLRDIMNRTTELKKLT